MKKQARRIRIHYSSDVHGKLWDGGLWDCLAAQRSADLRLDAGDMLQGSLLSEYCQRVLKDPSPMAELMNALGYTHLCPGNHDFNGGLSYLAGYIEALDGQMLCANMEARRPDLQLAPYAMVDLPQGVKVGVVGLVTKHIPHWEKAEQIKDVSFLDPIVAARKAIQSIEAEGGVDLLIGLYHGGYEANADGVPEGLQDGENQGHALCQALPFDLLLTGHQHRAIAGHLRHGTYTLQVPAHAEAVAAIDIRFLEGHTRAVHRLAIRHEEIKASQQESLPLPAALQVLKTEADAWADEALARLPQAIAEKPPLERATEGSPMVALLHAMQHEVSGAEISVCSLPNRLTGLPEELRRRHLLENYPYYNTLECLRVTGKMLMAAMERSAAYFAIDEEGKLGIAEEFLYPKLQHYLYDYYGGVDYQFDPRKPLGKRLLYCHVQGKPVQEDAHFTLCLPSYRAAGNGQYPMYLEATHLETLPLDITGLLMDYVARCSQERWQKIFATPRPLIRWD